MNNALNQKYAPRFTSKKMLDCLCEYDVYGGLTLMNIFFLNEGWGGLTTVV
jgi:hypothetical protein